MISDHEKWLNNEYAMWIKALKESSVYDFKEHPMVERMLGSIPLSLFSDLVSLTFMERELMIRIDSIGYSKPTFTGTALRMIYYARKVLELNPSSIVEIGGGVGEFCAILYALGYKGIYYIHDLDPVKSFQNKYLREVENQIGLTILPQAELSHGTDLCVSFYALGEFDDVNKKYYIDNIMPNCKHGFVIWNPHSGATAEIPFECSVSEEYPLTSPNNLQLIW